MEFLAYFIIFLCASLELSTIRGEHENAFGVYNYSAKLPQETTLDVTEFGAVGDGKIDDSRAFEVVWAAACQKVADSSKITVPIGKRFLVSPIEFGGPCKCQNITLEILGSIVAQPKLAWENDKKGEWLKFQGVDGLTVAGNGQGLIDGQGDSWWSNADNARPVAILFTQCNDLQVSGLKHINSQKFHVSLSFCNNANISNLHMVAPPKSPNTDGIDINSSSNIRIQNCTIETGDDCIAIKGGTSNVTISGIVCGPGHGISIGSLGQNGKHDQVEAIDISNCTLNGTQNGIRIKTWQGGSGFARNINFSDINFISADNPVIIDQFYCPHMTCTNKIWSSFPEIVDVVPKIANMASRIRGLSQQSPSSAVEVSDVRYTRLSGTSASKKATINFSCSDTIPCTNIMLDNVDIQSIDPRYSVSALCINAYGTAHNASSPAVNCLKSKD